MMKELKEESKEGLLLEVGSAEIHVLAPCGRLAES